MKQTIFFTICIAANQITDVFLALSGFLLAYKCLQIAQANGGRLYFTDGLRLVARKYLRLAPMLYFVFFFGWACGARLEDGPNWTNYQSLFLQCDKYWWAQLLMIGNIVPFFEDQNGGCFYWAWTFYCDLQLALLVPLYVAVYSKSRRAGVLLQGLIVVLGSVLLMAITV